MICKYKVSPKKWDLLLVIVAVNPTFLGGHLVKYFVDTIKFNTIIVVMADFRDHLNQITILGFQSNAYFDEMRFQSWS